MSTKRKQEIDHRTIKLLVGLGAMLLPVLTRCFASGSLDSISASYYENGWSHSIFIGFLFAISALMLAYNGESRWERNASKGAAIAGFAVALFPCACGDHKPPVPYVHGIAAAVMFGILVYLCHLFRERARGKVTKEHPQALRRVWVYTLCAGVIVLSMLVVAAYSVSESFHASVPQLVFYCEFAGLEAFGIAWFTASHVVPYVAGKEQFWPLREKNPS